MRNVAVPIAELKAAQARAEERARIVMKMAAPEANHDDLRRALAILDSEDALFSMSYGLQPLDDADTQQANIDKLRRDEYVRTAQYRDQRVSEYPPMSDFLDAFYWMQKGRADAMEKWVTAVDAVKSKYPKPQ